MIDDCYINNIAKTQVFAIFHSRCYLQKRVTQIYRTVYGDVMFVSFWGAQIWRP